MRIGLLGGSFDPAHEGHVHISQQALHRFRLDQVWWLVSPGNPLKINSPAPLERRIRHARAMIDHPRIHVTDIEAQLATRYTVDTVRHLRARLPGVRWVWLMGADNLAEFHRWRDWPGIMRTLPLGVLARPGSRQIALHSPAARRFRKSRLQGRRAGLLAGQPAPAWCFVQIPMRPHASRLIRDAGAWPATTSRLASDFYPE